MFPRFRPDPAFYPFQSRWCRTSRGTVHYIDEGDGPLLLFLHGSPTWSFLYRDVVVRLRDRYRCVAVDHLGFGLSERPEGFGYTVAEHTAVLAELIAQLDLRDYVVIGHDWGGPIGLGAAVRDPARVRGVAVTNTVLWPVRPVANRLFSRIMSSRPMTRRILDDDLLVERFLLPSISAHDAVADHYRNVFPDPASRAALAVAPQEIRGADALLATLERDIVSVLSGVPAVAIWGMRDQVFRPRHCLPRLGAIFDDLHVVTVGRSGHFVPEDAAADVAVALAERF